MKELIDLMVAATRFLESITPADGKPLPSTATAAPAPKAKRTRKKKAETAAAAPTVANGAESNGHADMTPEESMKQALDVAKAFVQRFQKANPDGLTRAKALLAERFKVAKIGDLVHDQRIEFVKTLTDELNAEKPA